MRAIWLVLLMSSLSDAAALLPGRQKRAAPDYNMALMAYRGNIQMPVRRLGIFFRLLL